MLIKSIIPMFRTIYIECIAQAQGKITKKEDVFQKDHNDCQLSIKPTVMYNPFR